jgi:hypothetical protein
MGAETSVEASTASTKGDVDSTRRPGRVRAVAPHAQNRNSSQTQSLAAAVVKLVCACVCKARTLRVYILRVR